MSALEIMTLAAAGFVAGIANAIAGGGTFFTFAALVAFGVPALDANVTSAIALVPGSVATGVAYRKETMEHWREILPFALIGAIGGICGASLLIAMGDKGFRPLVPWLIGGATLLFALSPKIRSYVEKHRGQDGIGRNTGFVIISVVALYGGFFGAGMGIMLLAALAIMGSGDFHEANATKNAVATVSQFVAVILFAAGGLVRWPEAIVTTLAAIAGGYVGVLLARALPEALVRAAVVTVGAALTLVFFLR
jgi:uncharacterized protein